MAWVFTRAADGVSTLNLWCDGASYVSGGKAFYSLKECMKTAGWTAIACGTGSGGSVYTDDTGPRITLAVVQSAGTGRAWIAMQAPNGKVVVMQKGDQAANYNQVYWRIKVIYAGGVNSDGTATQTPSPVIPANQFYLCGGGTDAAPTYETFGSDQSNGIAHCACDNANNYGFWATGYLSGYLSMHHGTIFMDGLDSTVADDVDPCIYCWKQGQSSDQNSRTTLHSCMKGWYKNASGVWTAGAIPGAAPVYSIYTDSYSLIANMKTDPWTGKSQYIRVPYGKNSGGVGGVIKGWGKSIILVGETKGNTSLRSIWSTKDYMQLGIYLFPWDGSSVPVG